MKMTYTIGAAIIVGILTFAYLGDLLAERQEPKDMQQPVYSDEHKTCSAGQSWEYDISVPGKKVTVHIQCGTKDHFTVGTFVIAQ